MDKKLAAEASPQQYVQNCSSAKVSMALAAGWAKMLLCVNGTRFG